MPWFISKVDFNILELDNPIYGFPEINAFLI
jgi:hypothetical protein